LGRTSGEVYRDQTTRNTRRTKLRNSTEKKRRAGGGGRKERKGGVEGVSKMGGKLFSMVRKKRGGTKQWRKGWNIRTVWDMWNSLGRIPTLIFEFPAFTKRGEEKQIKQPGERCRLLNCQKLTWALRLKIRFEKEDKLRRGKRTRQKRGKRRSCGAS